MQERRKGEKAGAEGSEARRVWKQESATRTDGDRWWVLDNGDDTH